MVSLGHDRGEAAKRAARDDVSAPTAYQIDGLTVTPLALDGVMLIVPQRWRDARGHFAETYNKQMFKKIGVDSEFVQDNQSFSARRGTIRGLHFQAPPQPQAKLVRVIRGAILDVAVDLRRASPGFGRWCSAMLTAQGGEQLFIPHGYAHGFCTIDPATEVAYKVDAFYARQCEGGVAWNDPDIGIAWPVSQGDALLSERDCALPRLRDLASPFSV
jgi:dTDP-4-dehydrorhamnose 3,5-epimerase